ncbi:MAG: DUF190 domain-containing protein [Ignavibacteriaceae bacterium]|nr:DUF190 domain-containing protein [Ignavibacteriaceae bacterium]
MKKLEVIIESVQLKHVLRILKDCDISGYTLINDVSGMGKHGIRRGFELTDVTKNVMLIIVEEPEKVYKAAEKINTVLKNFYGMILISDVEVFQ